MSHSVSIYTPHECSVMISERAKILRLKCGYKQTTLADMAGVSLASLKRFEADGTISLVRLLKIAHALGCMDGAHALFPDTAPQTLAELEESEKHNTRTRGRL